jgi:HD superfamily phosphodiesterase
MSISEKIISAEKKYKQILEDFFIKKWAKTILYSHDLDHHRRVWYYAKELLTETGETCIDNSLLTEMLIIACYLHDIGMSSEIGERHGVFSSRLCKEFLALNGLPESEFPGLLDIIENHDKKEYELRNNSKGLLSILNESDDLDAFGYIGIYRYIEIYLLRGIPKEEIGLRVRENAGRRFANFESVFGKYPAILERHQKRFRDLDDFFSAFNNQVYKNNSDNIHNNEPASVIELISEMLSEKIAPQAVVQYSLRSANESAARNFLKNLCSELNGFSTLL